MEKAEQLLQKLGVISYTKRHLRIVNEFITDKTSVMDKKSKKIIEDAGRENIPIFILTAKDECSIKAIDAYRFKCIDYGCTSDHVDAIEDRIREFETWQENNPDKVKLPD